MSAKGKAVVDPTQVPLLVPKEEELRVELEKLSATIRQDVVHVLHVAKTKVVHPIGLRILAWRILAHADELDRAAADAEHSGVG